MTKKPNPHADLIELSEGLRSHYPKKGNAIGAMLDELIKDLKAGKPRKKITRDATKLRTQLDPRSTAYRLLGQAVAALS